MVKVPVATFIQVPPGFAVPPNEPLSDMAHDRILLFWLPLVLAAFRGILRQDDEVWAFWLVRGHFQDAMAVVAYVSGVPRRSSEPPGPRRHTQLFGKNMLRPRAWAHDHFSNFEVRKAPSPAVVPPTLLQAKCWRVARITAGRD